MWDAEIRIGCQDCIYWTNRYEVQPCQHRIDHEIVKVHYPPFSTCYDNEFETPEYGVPTYDIVFGKPYDQETGWLNATKKRYCIRHKKSNKYPTGTEIVTEDINGVNIKEEWEKIQNGND